MWVYQLLNDPGLGHCHRLLKYYKRHIERKEPSVVLVPYTKKLVLYLKNQGIQKILQYDVSTSPDDLIKLVKEYSQTRKIREWVIDTKLDCEDLVLALRNNKVFSTLIDNCTNSRLLADKNIYPTPLFDKSDLDWKGYNGIIKGGLKELNINKTSLSSSFEIKRKSKNILISFGGEDPNELTIHTMKALKFLDKKYEILVIIGPLFSHEKKIKKLNQEIGHRFKLVEKCYDLSNYIFNSDCLITAIGTTLFEALALKTPSVVLSNYRSDIIDEIKLRKFKNISPMGYYQKIINSNDLLLNAVKQRLNTTNYL
ncbi:MAG: hypothetical protein CBB97_00635 [Candidatus Endolissoclinum sp. TMED37]|nr:MAG: hypothetical protein CBB97_00635 [Candidatus Endolissoclinum sp. TMED37]|tara:strand:- start:1398 stop:2333 length:936 start_codon:yes stop_codon:yes gene_type:complete